LVFVLAFFWFRVCEPEGFIRTNILHFVTKHAHGYSHFNFYNTGNNSVQLKNVLQNAVKIKIASISSLAQASQKKMVLQWTKLVSD